MPESRLASMVPAATENRTVNLSTPVGATETPSSFYKAGFLHSLRSRLALQGAFVTVWCVARLLAEGLREEGYPEKKHGERRESALAPDSG